MNRVLGLRWGDVDPGLSSGQHPLKLKFRGRKGHTRIYHTYLGRDSIEALKSWREKWTAVARARIAAAERKGMVPERNDPSPRPDDLIFISKRGVSGMDHDWLNTEMRATALRMASQGLVENGDRLSWHSHFLRHSFKTEGEHAKVPSGLVEFMMGHTAGISWVYDNRDETHEEDFLDAYAKLEPYVSLDYNEARASDDRKESARQTLELISSLQRRITSLESRQGP